MNINENLLIEQDWVGTFFPPGREDLAFGGHLLYSPTDGVRLSFAIPVGTSFGGPYKYLHGVIGGGIPCTLVGDFKPERSEFSMTHGYSYWTAKKYPFLYVLFGAHCEDKTPFDSFHFDITGSQEFFASSASMRYTQYKKEAILNAPIDVGSVNVHHSGTFDFVPNDLRAILHDNNEEALESLQMAFEQVKNNHPKFQPFLKKTLAHNLELRLAIEKEVADGYALCSSISNLFSLLFFNPAKLSRFHAIGRDKERKAYRLPVFPSVISERDTIDRSLAERRYEHLPLNISDVDLPTLISNWRRDADKYATIVSMIQSQGSVISTHAVLASIVLSATQFEDMAFQAGATNDKFGFGPRKFASDRLRTRLSTLLGCAADEIGQAISDLRNEIAHVGRPKKLLTRLTTKQRHEIARALETIVVGHVLENLGVAPSSRDKFQNALVFN